MQQERIIDEDLLILEKRIKFVFDSIFQKIPHLDCSDFLDGESLEVFQGKKYDEIPEIITNDADALPFFSTVSWKVGCYYSAGYILLIIKKIKLAREYYLVTNFPVILNMEYITLISFLKKPKTIVWIKSIPELLELMINFLVILKETAGFELNDDQNHEIDKLVKTIQGVD